jgi:hypothetical protein
MTFKSNFSSFIFSIGTIAEMLYSSMFHSFSTLNILLQEKEKPDPEGLAKKNIWD